MHTYLTRMATLRSIGMGALYFFHVAYGHQINVLCWDKQVPGANHRVLPAAPMLGRRRPRRTACLHMALFELVFVGAVLCTCSALGWLASQPVLPRHTAVFVANALRDAPPVRVY